MWKLRPKSVMIHSGWTQKLIIPKAWNIIVFFLHQYTKFSGIICGYDPSKGSCFDTGDSGSGLLLERLQGGYSWEGPLSFYRGCQNEFISFGKSLQVSSSVSHNQPAHLSSYRQPLHSMLERILVCLQKAPAI